MIYTQCTRTKESLGKFAFHAGKNMKLASDASIVAKRNSKCAAHSLPATTSKVAVAGAYYKQCKQ